MFPRAELRQNRSIAAVDGVQARRKYVRNLSLKDEHGGLRFAHGQPRSIFDFLIVNRKAIEHRVTRVVEPLDDFYELSFERVKYSHLFLTSPCWAVCVGDSYYTVKAEPLFKQPTVIGPVTGALCVYGANGTSQPGSAPQHRRSNRSSCRRWTQCVRRRSFDGTHPLTRKDR